MSTTTMSQSTVVLHGIRFETFERIAEELESPGIRLTYDRGSLELMTPSRRHEKYKTLLAMMVEAMVQELRIPMDTGGSTTFKRPDLEKGIEPDECYWIQNERKMRGKDEIDLAVDPPPDLVLEAEATRNILDRLGILAAIGVPELWRYDGERLTILLLDTTGSYAESPTSRCFPWLPIEQFVAHLAGHGNTDETSWILRFRAWVRESLAEGSAGD